jgi:hypothetical protein
MSLATKETLPENPSDEDVKKHEIAEGMMGGMLNVHQTTALYLVFLLQIVAMLGALTTFLMTRRTDRPAPRIEFRW